MNADYFKNKKITLMGLGLLGRGVGDAKFLAESGADLIVTDIKTEEELKSSLEQLKEYKNISYTLGEHKLEDFRDRDLIIRGAAIPADSPYIEEARRNQIEVQMSTALLVRTIYEDSNLDVRVIGVTGTRGKTTVTKLIYSILKKAGKPVYLGGNIQGVSTLSLLPILKSGDILVLELDSWQLQGFFEDDMSPEIGIFTNFYPDHQDYYNGMNKYFLDKTNIFEFQNDTHHFIMSNQIKEMLKNYVTASESTWHVASSEDFPPKWNLKLLGEHNKENAVFAIKTALVLGIDKKHIKEAVEEFEPVEGRLSFACEVDGVKYYNDNSSTTPTATLAALRALGEGKKIILIMGGTDKDIDMEELVDAIPKYCKTVVLLTDESGSERIKKDVESLDGVKILEGRTPQEIFQLATSAAQFGDIVLFSPAFASFGKHYVNVYDRGEQFKKYIDSL